MHSVLARRLANRTIAGMIVLVPVIALQACQTTGPERRTTTATAAIDGSDPGLAQRMCAVFRPIYWSRLDSEETIRQVVVHNAGWDALCAPSQTLP